MEGKFIFFSVLISLVFCSYEASAQTLWQKAQSVHWPEPSDKAIKYLDTLISTQPSDSAYYFRAALKEEVGDSIGALVDFNSALAITKKDSSNILAFKSQLEVFFDYGAALRDVELSDKINPYGNAYGLIGQAFLTLEKYDTAISYFTKQIDKRLPLTSSSFMPFSSRGIAKYYTHDFKGALADLDTGILYSPYCPWCYKYRVKIKIESGLIEEACKDYDMIKELYNEDTEIHILMDKYCKK